MYAKYEKIKDENKQNGGFNQETSEETSDEKIKKYKQYYLTFNVLK
jgi:cell division protein FtsL